MFGNFSIGFLSPDFREVLEEPPNLSCVQSIFLQEKALSRVVYTSADLKLFPYHNNLDSSWYSDRFEQQQQSFDIFERLFPRQQLN